MNKWLNEMFEETDKPKSWMMTYVYAHIYTHISIYIYIWKHFKLLQLNVEKLLSGIDFYSDFSHRKNKIYWVHIFVFFAAYF